MNTEPWIVSTPDTLGGAWRIRDTRISVALIQECLATGETVDDILNAYPHLCRAAVEAARDFKV